MKKTVFALAASAVVVASFAFTTIAKSPVTNVENPPAAVQAPGKWVLDKPHTNVRFSVAHLVVSDVDGSFKSFDGSMTAAKPDFSDAAITFTADVASINTDNENRDKHLQSDDFFNAAKFPQIKFVSKSFQPLGDNKYKLVGDLTIRDITKTVTFDVTYGGTVTAMGGTHAGFKAKTTINRFDYNLKWSAATEAGGLVVGKDVEITLNIDMKKA
ncbi:MAG TPA: YceI family protein [Chitinophagaceae bacterium]|nr:YceI family protein [Chitinophagaceae bacterium]